MVAGGCFWGVQAVFQHVKGVTQVLSGYSGGTKDTAEYEVVSSGTTGARSVQIKFDPRQISYGRILQICASGRARPDRGSTARARTPARSIARRSSLPTLLSRASPRPTSRERQGACVQAPDRDTAQPTGGVLPGRGLSPGLRDAAPEQSLHLLQRSAEGRKPQADVPGSLSRPAGAGRQRGSVVSYAWVESVAWIDSAIVMAGEGGLRRRLSAPAQRPTPSA